MADFTTLLLTAHYSGKLDTTGTTLTADLDYVALTDKRESEFINLYQRRKRTWIRPLRFTHQRKQTNALIFIRPK